jgi:glycosyltransferase involved in cell wall biosynthesis
VLFEPQARVVHLDGATFGSEAAPGVSARFAKSGQRLNRVLFQAKWAEELLHHFPRHTAAALRGGRLPDRPRVLVCDNDLYPPDQSSGGQRMAWILRLLHELGCEVTFFPFDRRERQPYADWLRRMGVEVWCTGGELEELAAQRPGLYDLVILCRPTTSANLRDTVRRHFPAATLVYDTVDLHFLRLERELAVAPGRRGSDAAEHDIRRARRTELDEVRAADVVATVTEAEADLLRGLVPGIDTVVLPNVHGVRPTPVPGPDDRTGLLFIGGYRHRPNVDAMTWFASDILQRVRAQVPTRLTALGAGPTPEVEALASDAVEVPGYRNDVSGAFDHARVFVSPLRYGAGMKGKIGMAMALGLPVVTTTIGAEGMGLVDGTHALVADEPEAFADAVVRLCRDDELWTRLSEEARHLVTAAWSPGAMADRLGGLLTRTTRATPRSMVPRTWGLLDPEGPIGPAGPSGELTT